MKNIILITLIGLSAAVMAKPQGQLILSDTKFFEQTGIPIVSKHPRLGMAVGRILPEQEERVHNKVHEMGRCGGFELLNEPQLLSAFNIETELADFEKIVSRDQKLSMMQRPISLQKNDAFAAMAESVSAENLKRWVEWMQGFGTRSHSAREPNRPVIGLEQEVKNILKDSSLNYKVETLTHSRTRQNTIRVSLIGKTEPATKIILGAHYDSTAGWGSGEAPGADDNASGSSNLLEVLRILSAFEQPNRSIEFYWYAGEEGGLIGSAEIARSYKDQRQNVLAVMQLDMTLFPGDGAFRLGNVTDFTTPWVREFLKGINNAYFKYEVNDFECGYGCSDHASWYRNGFATVAPFEARMNTMNRQIHTSRDRVQASYNFDHSAAFSKLALVFALELDRYTP